MTAGALATLPHLHTGKVRDLYEVGEGRILLITSDRLSAFDVVMGEPIPEKGRVLTAMTSFWCERLADVVACAHLTCDPAVIAADVPGFDAERALHGRATLQRRAEMVPLECIVRARLAGQAFEEYRERGTIHSTPAPRGLVLADELEVPLFTPSTKATAGHDVNLSFDEVVTPDSSRIWLESSIVPGEVPAAFDKQPFRDWLAGLPWDRTPPPPVVPADVVAATSRRYVECYERVTGRSLDDWYGHTP